MPASPKGAAGPRAGQRAHSVATNETGLRRHNAHEDRPGRPAVDRFARHHALDGIGQDGQRRIQAGRVLVVGVGGLGCPAARYLAAAGVGRMTLCDFGEVDLPDLQRQVLFGAADVGRPKATQAALRLREAHPDVRIDAVDAPFSADMIAGHDVVVDGTDEPATRAFIHQTCRQAGAPLVWGGLEAWTGQATTMMPDGPCLDCLMPRDLEAPACADVGVFGPLAGTVGTIMAGEVVKVLLGAPALQGRLVLWDPRSGDLESIPYARLPDCPVCSEGAL